MANLWGGRFAEEADALVTAFNQSLPFDLRLLPADIAGSIAHARMLGKQGILSETESAQIVEGLTAIRKDLDAGVLVIDEEAEDVHSFLEAELTARIGEAGKKVHTGRSRNDQVALAMRLTVRDLLSETAENLLSLEETLLSIMKEHKESYMPGFTHLQKAQPTTLAHHLGAYVSMFRRDEERLASVYERMNVCPLGAGAMAGTTYPIDREAVARELGFARAAENSMDAVADRDYLLDYLGALSTIAMHLSRLSEEIILWNSEDVHFIELKDSYATGSSIMPQKKNPDIAELIRGKCGRVYGALFSLYTVMKGLPLAYNKDLQEDKELTFDAIDTVNQSLVLMRGMLGAIMWQTARMEEAARGGFSNATDAADYLVKKGVAFRDAHEIIGQLVRLAIEKGKRLEELPLADFKAASDVFAEDIFDAISLAACVGGRKSKGAPGAIEEEIHAEEMYLAAAKERWGTK